VILAVTVGLAVTSYRRGWDLDSVSTPMVTAIGDMVTLPSLFLASLVVRTPAANAVTAAIGTLLAFAAIGWVLTRGDRTGRRVLAEMIPMIAIVPILDVFAGALLQANAAELEAVAAVLIVIPPFISQAGALGGILSSRLGSKLQVGVITARGRPEAPALVDGSIVVLSGLVVFTAIGLLAPTAAELVGIPHPGIGTMTGLTLIAGLLVLPVVLVAGYYVAIGTSRFGLDPDNYGVPTLTSLMDLVGVGSLLFVLSVSGVLHG
jgi:mgtE-like transporter